MIACIEIGCWNCNTGRNKCSSSSIFHAVFHSKGRLDVFPGDMWNMLDSILLCSPVCIFFSVRSVWKATNRCDKMLYGIKCYEWVHYRENKDGLQKLCFQLMLPFWFELIFLYRPDLSLHLHKRWGKMSPVCILTSLQGRLLGFMKYHASGFTVLKKKKKNPHNGSRLEFRIINIVF